MMLVLMPRSPEIASVPRSDSIRTCGVRSTRFLKSRPLIGSALISSVWIVVEADVFVISTVGTSPTTVTVSATEALWSVKLTVTGTPRSSRTFSVDAGWNPSRVAETV